MGRTLHVRAGGLRELASTWREELEVATRHPWHAPSDPRYRPAGIVYFFVVGIASIVALVVLASGTPREAPLFVAFALAAVTTGLAQIRLRPERQVILNDLFFVVPFVFFPVAASALLILLVGLVDPVVHPRSLVRVMARLSSMLTMRLAALGGVVLAKEFVPDGYWWSAAVIAISGLLAVRINDLTQFAVSLRLGLGRDFSYREYVVETVGSDILFLGLEVPLIAVAATVYPQAPWLVVALVIPYFAAWRLALLRPAVDALREADELKSRFLSMASHELRTPLTSISGFATTLRDRWDDLPDEQKREFLLVIDLQALRLARLIEQLLTMSRIEAGALVTNVESVELRDVLERACAGAGVEDVEVDCDAELRVLADPDHLEQIVINFLGNAHKYGAPPIEVTAQQVDDDSVEVRVIDHGPGVPAWFRASMYEQFAQASTGDDRSARGTGLGLTIVKRLAEALRAEVDYEPVSPHGACFIVRLRAAPPPD